MNDLIVKQFEGKDVRMMSENDEPWFVLADVLKAMGTTTPVTKVVSSIEQGLGDGFTSSQPIVDSLGRTQQVTIVQAPAVTFILSRSNTEEGRRLNQWIHSVVLPSIRTNGGYIAGQEHTDDPALIMARGLQAAQSIIDQKSAQLMAATRQIEEQKPLVDFAEKVSRSNDAINLGDFAKVISGKSSYIIGRNSLFELLRAWAILDRRNQPYQHYIELGWFTVREGVYENEKTNGPRVCFTTMITGKGQLALHKKISEYFEMKSLPEVSNA